LDFKMNVDTQLEYLTEAIEDRDPPISKQEMERMLSDVQKSKELKAYRQVTEAPVVVDVVDISDAAAKKLAQKLKPESKSTNIPAPSTGKSSNMLSKIIEFTKGSFINIIKMIGGVIGWVTSTITSVISSVTNWVLGRIQKAMLFSIAKSATNMGGRFSKLGLIVKAAAAASAGLAMYNVYEGISNFQSKLDNINSAAESAFSDPESILTSGMTGFSSSNIQQPSSPGTVSSVNKSDSSESITNPEDPELSDMN